LKEGRILPPELIVLSQEKAGAYEPIGLEICISIRDPNLEPPQLSPKFAEVLRLCFSDIAKPGTSELDVLFDETHAAEIIDFVERWPNAQRIVIHCMAGLGRSPGVALALCERFGLPTETLESEKPLFNKWVRAQLAKAWRERQR
jgi:predicted protein tyrosine phosphatase